MRQALGIAALLLLLACTPGRAPRQLPGDCQAKATQNRLLVGNWLYQGEIWRLRQSALLELGPRKLALEGFLRLDLQRQQAQLLAMNEMGLVLFDLQVWEQGEQLQRAIPQLQQIKGFAQGVAQSLRQIYLSPRAQPSDHLQNRNDSQRLWRLQPGGSLGFIYDCLGDLRETRLVADNGDWQINYDDYRNFAGGRLPEQIVLNDFQHGVKLSLWIREVKQEP